MPGIHSVLPIRGWFEKDIDNNRVVPITYGTPPLNSGPVYDFELPNLIAFGFDSNNSTLGAGGYFQVPNRAVIMSDFFIACDDPFEVNYECPLFFITNDTYSNTTDKILKTQTVYTTVDATPTTMQIRISSSQILIKNLGPTAWVSGAALNTKLSGLGADYTINI
jgi:hypothetical protein